MKKFFKLAQSGGIKPGFSFIFFLYCSALDHSTNAPPNAFLDNLFERLNREDQQKDALTKLNWLFNQVRVVCINSSKFELYSIKIC